MGLCSCLGGFLLAVLGGGNAGLINVYSSDRNVRMEQLLYQSGDLGRIHDEWREFWMKDQPSHMKYLRVHGGIGP